MTGVSQQIKDNHKYLQLLSGQYPTIQSVCTEIINLRAILNLPKGTEHFLSDLHGEYEAFTHILNNCSGVIREKVDDVFGSTLDEDQRAELCTLIYYPESKLEQIKQCRDDLDRWYTDTLLRLIEVCKVTASKYTRSKVRKALPSEYSYIIDELLHADYGETNQTLYYQKIMESILAVQGADGFITQLATLIKRLAVDHLHIVGDIFDRGPRPDLIMDLLMDHHSVDIQWGNHDILWMGAAAGSEACVAAVLTNSAAYGNLKVLEQGYGINLRSLALFADRTYSASPRFVPRQLAGGDPDEKDSVLAGKIYKALAVIMLKTEGQLLLRHPEYNMQGRLLLDKIDLEKGEVRLREKAYPVADLDLPTLSAAEPYALSPEESYLLAELRDCFLRSERLQRHVRFLYSHGSMYRIFNQNLLFHGCIPMEEDGSFTTVNLCGKSVYGKALMDQADRVVRAAYFGADSFRQQAQDAVWYLWCGRKSPLFGRSRMTTFERFFIEDESTWAEHKDPYYTHIQSGEECLRILEEFGLDSDISHIVNGHVPVRAASGETPIKGEGRLVVIDGGFCRAYQPRTGIAGYTLIYNSYGLRLSAHMPFQPANKLVEDNIDIHSTTHVFEKLEQRLLVMDTDIGHSISDQIYNLSLLLTAYRSGKIAERRK